MSRVTICMLIMAGTTYLIRVIPIGFIKKRLDNKWIQDFLYYIPFCVLAAMTFPGIFYSTAPDPNSASIQLSAIIATQVAIVMAWKNKGLVKVAIVAVIAAILVELVKMYFF